MCNKTVLERHVLSGNVHAYESSPTAYLYLYFSDREIWRIGPLQPKYIVVLSLLMRTYVAEESHLQLVAPQIAPCHDRGSAAVTFGRFFRLWHKPLHTIGNMSVE
jgi:hypothetical protein